MQRNRNDNRKLLGTYSVFFAVFFFFCILIYNIIFKKNLFTNADGISQQYTFFLFTGKWIRRLLKNVFIDHVFEYPMWNMNLIGYDTLIVGDIFLFDPFCWISAFVPMRYGEIAFNISVIMRFYFSGLAFLFFCRQTKTDTDGALVGSLAYVFSGTVLIGIVQASYMNVYFLFPMLMVGVDRLWKEKRFVFYTLIVAYCTLCSFYLTYIMGLTVIFYCVIRFFFEEDRSIKRLLQLIGRFLVFTIIGVGIGIGLIIPGIISMSGLDRLEIKRPFHLFYSWERIKSLIGGCFSFSDLQFEAFFGVSAVLIPAVYVMIRKRKKYRKHILLLAIYYVSFFFPFIGSFFNGNNYACHRYIIGFILLEAYIIAITFKEFSGLTEKDWTILMAVSAGFIVPGIIVDELFGILSAVSAILTVFAMRMIYLRHKGNDIKRLIMIPLFISCALIGVCFGINITMPRGIDIGKAGFLVLDSEGKELVVGQPDTDKIRYDKLTNYNGQITSNTSMLLDLNGYDFYHSNYNPYIEKYIDDLGIIGDAMSFCYRNLHGRNYVELMNGTRYITAQDGLTYNVPFSYSPSEGGENANGYSLYTADTDTSMVYFYDNAISYEQYDLLDPVEREDILMDYVVLDNVPGNDPGDPDISYEPVPYEIKEIYGLTMDGNRIDVTDSEAYIVLGLDVTDRAELDLVVRDLVFDVTDDQDTMRYQITPYLTYNGNTVCSEAYVAMTPNISIYHYRKDWVFNFNIREQAVDSVTIFFDTEGSYTLDDILIYSRSAGAIERKVAAFNEMADMDNVQYDFTDNRISITADAFFDRYLYLAVPYAEGWSCTVDGIDTEILRANTAFMAIPVTEGVHDVEFQYRTPHIDLGLTVSAVSVCTFVIIIIGTRAYRKRAEHD